MAFNLRLFHINQLEENDSIGLEHDGKSMFAVKKDAQIHVYENRCPHLEVNLEWQPNDFLDSDKVFIQCSTHGALFEIKNGQCISGPCLGDRLTPISIEIKENGDVFLGN